MKRNSVKPLLLAIVSAYAAQASVLWAETVDVGEVEVISTTPIKGVGVPVEQIPAAVQTVKAKDIQKSQSLDITDYMNRHMSGVYINETQNNPLQPDINYRGFTASPLLGTPQGLSVYMDGVRLNQPFGDVVSWDLIPRIAIQGMQMMPGSNPLFGLNTLGGALSIQTKDGRTAPGGAIQATLGSYGRKMGEFEYGTVDDNKDYYVAGSFFDENGWRDQSDSDYQQLFSKVGWHGEKTDIHLTLAYAHSDLNGNGLAPRSLLRQNYNNVYSYPDNTTNESFFSNLNWSHYFTDNVTFSGNAYLRKIRTRTFNGDINDTALPDVAITPDSGQTVMPNNSALAYNPTLSLARCTAQLNSALDPTDSGEPGEKCTGVINRTSNEQWNAGIFGQFTVQNQLFEKANQYIVGGGFDYSRSHFIQSSEYGVLQLDRGIIGTGYYADQSTAGNVDGELDDRAVNLKGNTKTWSLFGTDTLNLAQGLFVTASARYNNVKVVNRDQLTHYNLDAGLNAIDTTSVDDESDLSGSHRFQRLNGAIGLTYSPNNAVNYYAGYNEGSRAPTAIELGCANPNNGCRLPNSMAGDPPLNQVVTKTWEAGVRVRESQSFSWNVGVFTANNYDDIMFLASNATGEGYFKNFGQTRRSGLEAGFGSELGDLSLGANYTYLDATYRSREMINSTANSSAVTLTDANGNDYQAIQVKSGDKIPGVPNHILKIYANYRVNDQWSVGANTLSIGDSYLRGNENNNQSSTTGYSGDGKAPGYTIVNLTAAFKATDQWSFFAKVNNVLDKEYYTSGMLGLNPLTANGNLAIVSGTANAATRRTYAYGDEFLSPGAPRTAWIGARYEFGGKKSAVSYDKD